MDINYIQNMIDDMNAKRIISREQLVKKRELMQYSYTSKACSKERLAKFTQAERKLYVARMKLNASKLNLDILNEYLNYCPKLTNGLNFTIIGPPAPIINLESLKYKHLLDENKCIHNQIIEDWIMNLKKSDEQAIFKYIELLFASSEFMRIPVLKEKIIFNKYLKKAIISVFLVDKEFLYPVGNCKYNEEINEIIVSKIGASKQNMYFLSTRAALSAHMRNIFIENNFFNQIKEVVFNFYQNDICCDSTYLNLETKQYDQKSGKPFDEVLSLESIN